MDLSGLDRPVIIDSIRLLENDGEQFVHVCSKDGAEGLSLTNRRPHFAPILENRIVPFFLGKDVRKLESELLFELYRYRSNYKLQGLAFWSAQAWVEFAILDMVGRITGKSMGELMGGVIRKEIDFYVASGRRDSTPEEEVEYLQSLIEETGAKAVKFRLGGRMSRDRDASPGRTEALITLSRKTLGGCHRPARRCEQHLRLHPGDPRGPITRGDQRRLLRGALPVRPPGRYEEGDRRAEDSGIGR